MKITPILPIAPITERPKQRYLVKKRKKKRCSGFKIDLMV